MASTWCFEGKLGWQTRSKCLKFDRNPINANSIKAFAAFVAKANRSVTAPAVAAAA